MDESIGVLIMAAVVGLASVGIGCLGSWLLDHSEKRRNRTVKKNRKKHDPLNYYSNRAESDAAKLEADRRSISGVLSLDGGYRRGAQAYRAGAAGSSIHGSYYGARAGTGSRMNMDEFSGIDQMIDPAMEEAGFAVGVVRGVRAFEVDALGRLRGVSFRQVWMPGENVAECRRSRTGDMWQSATMQFMLRMDGRPSAIAPEPVDYGKPHPMRDCKHGFYAYYDGSNDYGESDRVDAVIEGYGETVIGSRGFRCMKAQIVALHIADTVKPHVARMVARNYPDVPILESFDQMVSEFPPDSAGNEITPTTDPNFWTREA